METIRAILFDLDDTLFDRETAQLKTLELMVEQLPGIFLGIGPERITNAFLESDRRTTAEFDAGAPSDDMRNRRSRLFLGLLGLPEEHADTITAMYVRDYPRVNTPVPGVPEVVRELGKRFRIGVVSNGLSDAQYRKLETISVLDSCSCVILSEEIGIRKPDPAIFSLAAARLGAAPRECLFVGDSYTNDIIGAAGAGMATCWLNRKAVHQLDCRADFVIASLGELLFIFESPSSSV